MLEFEIRDLSFSLPNDPNLETRSDGSCPEKDVNIDPVQRSQFSSWGQMDGANRKMSAQALKQKNPRVEHKRNQG